LKFLRAFLLVVLELPPCMKILFALTFICRPCSYTLVHFCFRCPPLHF